MNVNNISVKRMAMQCSVHRASRACLAALSRQQSASHRVRDQAAAQEGATAPPPVEEPVNLHFAALVQRDGRCPALAYHPTGCSTQHAFVIGEGAASTSLKQGGLE